MASEPLQKKEEDSVAEILTFNISTTKRSECGNKTPYFRNIYEIYTPCMTKERSSIDPFSDSKLVLLKLHAVGLSMPAIKILYQYNHINIQKT